MRPMSPSKVIKEIADALPEECKANFIIVGSLAAAVRYFVADPDRALLSKDADGLIAPNAMAVGAAQRITNQLLAAGWQIQPGPWGQAGTADTPEKDLPVVRLVPPGDRNGADWFLELLGAPDLTQPADEGAKYTRVETTAGHFSLASFRFLAVTEWNPIGIDDGMRIARPEMMALANLLHHPVIGPATIRGTTDKRSNKDLGRVLALSWLAQHDDTRKGTDQFSTWGANMAAALREKFPEEAGALASSAGSGVRELLDSPADLAQALAIANRSLLASRDVGVEGFVALGRRFLQDVIGDLEHEFAGPGNP